MKKKMMMVKYDKKNERKVVNVRGGENKAGRVVRAVLIHNMLFTNLVHTLDHGTYLYM
jgi:hypothetical protein